MARTAGITIEAPLGAPDNDERRELPWFFLKEYAIPLPAPFATALGDIVVQWGALENDIARDMTLMMRFPLVRGLAHEPMRAFKKRIELWQRSVRALYPHAALYKQSAAEITKEAKRLSKLRNDLIHGQWTANTDKADERWIVFIEEGYDESSIRGFYVDEPAIESLSNDIRKLRMRIVEFSVNRMWHAHLGLLCESHEPELDNPAHLILRIDEWPQGIVGELDPRVPERFAKTFLFRD